MGIKVIGFAISTATLRVTLTLEELGLEYEFEPVTSITEIKTPEYLTTKNPFAKDIYYDAKRPNVVKWVKNLLEIPTWKQVLAKHKLE
ncbi:16295_t:CDS:2 [Entrophospora sp. SA101]|nr:16295_t:CDS:2 [Entrophospora sp. SA101]